MPPVGKINDQKMVEEIEKFIRKNLSGNNSILTICNTFGINQPYLSRIFKNCCNCTYNEFLTNIRIEEAKKMLETDDYLIGQIAEFTGSSISAGCLRTQPAILRRSTEAKCRKRELERTNRNHESVQMRTLFFTNRVLNFPCGF